MKLNDMGLQSCAGLAHRGSAIECRALQSSAGLWNRMLGSASQKKWWFYNKKPVRIGQFRQSAGLVAHWNPTLGGRGGGRAWDPTLGGGGEGVGPGTLPLGGGGGRAWDLIHIYRPWARSKLKFGEGRGGGAKFNFERTWDPNILCRLCILR